MAVDVEELTGRAVKAVKWHVVGVDCATTRTHGKLLVPPGGTNSSVGGTNSSTNGIKRKYPPY